MTAPVRVSLETFLGMEETKPYLELIDGEVVPKAMPGPKHSAAVVELITELRNFLRGHPIARVDTELRHLDRREARVYLPDVSVTLRERPDEASAPMEVPPDLAVEVLSPDDRAGRVAERVDFYLRAGTRLVWVIDPELETVSVYRPEAAPTFHRRPAILDAAPVLPGFRLDLGAYFKAIREA
ncbi:MAG TPA: Uma2 family endonuclease [Tepidiformaceae bacterium]|nr:Uma2 family endonuclease [Tepidiformaceae bacterium]